MERNKMMLYFGTIRETRREENAETDTKIGNE
jgi:hypothetical protein